MTVKLTVTDADDNIHLNASEDAEVQLQITEAIVTSDIPSAQGVSF